MNICMVLASNDFPPDTRVENEIESLINAGHNIVILANGEGTKNDENEWRGARIYRVFPPSGFFLRKLNAFIYLLFHFNYHWSNMLSQVLTDHDIEAIHIHDLPMAKTGLSAAKKDRLFLIVDLHEHYPEFLEFSRPDKPSLKERLYATFFYSSSRWRIHERKILLQSCRNIVVAEEAKERIAALGVPRNNIVVIRNTVNVKRFCSYPVQDTILASYQKYFIISYIGGLNRHRGLVTIVRALEILVESIPHVRLLFVGPRTDEGLESLIKQLHLDPYVFFTGWKDFSLVPSYMAASDLAVLVHEPNEHNATTLPHKLFQYMLAGIPLVVSKNTPMERVVRDANCGLAVEASDPRSLVTAIIKLWRNPELCRSLSQNGRKAVEARYNWQLDGRRLVEMYEKLQ